MRIHRWNRPISGPPAAPKVCHPLAHSHTVTKQISLLPASIFCDQFSSLSLEQVMSYSFDMDEYASYMLFLPLMSLLCTFIPNMPEISRIPAYLTLVTKQKMQPSRTGHCRSEVLYLMILRSFLSTARFHIWLGLFGNIRIHGLGALRRWGFTPCNSDIILDNSIKSLRQACWACQRCRLPQW